MSGDPTPEEKNERDQKIAIAVGSIVGILTLLWFGIRVQDRMAAANRARVAAMPL